MKQNRIYSLDPEVIERIDREENKSGFVNRVLMEWIEKERFLNLTPEELKIELKCIELREETEKKIKELKNGQ